MKKLLCIFIMFMMVINMIPVSEAKAKTEIKVTIDGKNVTFPDGKPFIDQNNRTMVPVRFVSENLGYKVIWNAKMKEVTIQDGKNIVKLKMGNKEITINGKKGVMDTEAKVIGSRTYVPLRFISQGLGSKLDYNTKTKQINIVKPTPVVVNPVPTTPTPEVPEENQIPVPQQPTLPDSPAVEKIYHVELSRWGIYNDGTNPVETTKGFNNALKWASENKYNVFKVPAGTYLISKGDGGWYNEDSYIVMPSNMTLLLDDQTIIQKETNGYTGYKTVVVPMFVENVVIKGGTFRGDKDTHDYYQGAKKWEPNKLYKLGDKVIPTNTVADSSSYYLVATNDGLSSIKEPAWSSYQNRVDNAITWKPVARDTHEGGYGIITYGAYNVVVDGVKAVNFTGDGLCIGGFRSYSEGAYANRFEAGSINENGQLIADSSKTRTKDFWSLTHPSFEKTNNFVIDMVTGVPQTFDVYFYQSDGTFVSVSKNQKRGYYVTIPEGATKFRLLFHGSYNSNIWMEFHNKIQSHNVIVKNSEFAFNRRQGITVGGGNNVLIENNEIHDIKGTMPQAGIDVEGGFWENGTLNTNITIKYNNFYNNAKYNVVLYDGNTALVEGNTFKDAIGVTIPSPFTNAIVKDNDFYHASIYAYHDVHFMNNKFKYSYTYITGPNVTIDGMEMEIARLFLYPKNPYDIKVNNIKMKGSTIGVWNNPLEFNNVSMDYYSAFDNDSMNKAPKGIIFNNFTTQGVHIGSLMPATYNTCNFVMDGYMNSTLVMDRAGLYEFNECQFSGSKFLGMKVNSIATELMMKNSTIDVPTNNIALTIDKAKKVHLEGNTIKSAVVAGEQKSVVMIGTDWTNTNPSGIAAAVIKNNTITGLSNVNGITTIFAGKDAPSYRIENNVLHNAVLNLKTNDTNINNN